MIDPYDAIGLGNARDKAEALATPVPGAVSDAMVERALKGWSDSHPEVHGNTKKALRAALEAAVQSPPIVDEALPCDVQIPGAKFNRGVKLSTLLLGIRRRSEWPEEDTRLSSLAPVEAEATEPVAVTRTDILREWFGGERYARDYEYIDANFGEQADRVVAYLDHPTGDSGALREALVQTRNHLDLIITDGIPMDWQAWRDDIEAALSKGEPGK